jgi:chemotaxis protein methyltransferase CheR
MDKRTFSNFRKFIYEKSGINIGDKKEALILNRVGKRMRALCIDDHRRYLKFVQEDESGRELVSLLDVVSTNVTHFYRDSRHFGFLADAAGRLVERGQRRFRIWCAASSTGEEPYSIAITMREATKEAARDVKILATDISTLVLDKARAGIYSKEKVADVPAQLRMNYFTSRMNCKSVVYEVKPEIKRMVRFARLNLSHCPYPMSGPFDVIFIRNVMIYFDNAVRKRLLDEAYRLLKTGGYLVVGHAESLAGLLNSKFTKTETSVYTK